LLRGSRRIGEMREETLFPFRVGPEERARRAEVGATTKVFDVLRFGRIRNMFLLFK
jgi:hypothetical protein